MAAISTEVRDGVLVIGFFDPELDKEPRIHQIGDELKEQVDESDCKHILLDFEPVNFMCSAMLGQLAMLSQRCASKKLNLKICNVAAEMREVLRIVRLDTLLDICTNQQDAIEAFKAAGEQTAAEDTNGEPEDELQQLQQSADAGDTEALFRLAKRYETGRGVAADYSTSLRYYRKAAEAGHCESQYAMAMCYAYGMNVQQDYDEATKWYLLAGEKGHAESQYAVGVNYRFGIGVERDIEIARTWYEKAAAQGQQKAQEAIEELQEES